MHTKKSFKVARPMQRGGMKTSALGTHAGGQTWFGRLLVAMLALFALAAAGCDEGHEGDRCVLALSHNDCASSDLTCMQPTDCPETYCCSANSTNAFCQAGCNGGALSILFASCNTSSPSPLCPCINIINGINLGPLPAAQQPPGVDCSCVSVPDPIACLAQDAGSATPDAGSATPDAGSATPDAGSTTPDAGSTTPDAGSPTPDAGGDTGGSASDASGG
jgi:hypothetical protein